eukprot:SAG31_NODE_5915_length_2257_cov_1.947173_2_plen_225_part_01
MRETRDATFGRLRKEWGAPPVALLDQALPRGWEDAAGEAAEDDDSAGKKIRAARLLIFDPTAAMMAHYPALISESATLKLQVPCLTLFYVRHVRHWRTLRPFVEAGGLSAVAALVGAENVYIRSQAIDIFQRITSGSDEFDWFGEPQEGDAKLFEGMRVLLDSGEFAKHLALSIPAEDFPGGTLFRLQILAFWLSWLRLHYTDDSQLPLGPRYQYLMLSHAISHY